MDLVNLGSAGMPLERILAAPSIRYRLAAPLGVSTLMVRGNGVVNFATTDELLLLTSMALALLGWATVVAAEIVSMAAMADDNSFFI